MRPPAGRSSRPGGTSFGAVTPDLAAARNPQVFALPARVGSRTLFGVTAGAGPGALRLFPIASVVCTRGRRLAPGFGLSCCRRGCVSTPLWHGVCWCACSAVCPFFPPLRVLFLCVPGSCVVPFHMVAFRRLPPSSVLLRFPPRPPCVFFFGLSPTCCSLLLRFFFFVFGGSCLPFRTCGVCVCRPLVCSRLVTSSTLLLGPLCGHCVTFFSAEFIRSSEFPPAESHDALDSNGPLLFFDPCQTTNRAFPSGSGSDPPGRRFECLLDDADLRPVIPFRRAGLSRAPEERIQRGTAAGNHNPSSDRPPGSRQGSLYPGHSFFNLHSGRSAHPGFIADAADQGGGGLARKKDAPGSFSRSVVGGGFFNWGRESA